MKPSNKPDRAIVERIVREEAASAGLPVMALLGGSKREADTRARHRAILRIREVTGCSERGLAEVWGISDWTVRNAGRELGTRVRRPKPSYDGRTIEALRWAHGEPRTAQIVAGCDPNTIRDLAAWRRVCVHGEPA